jgi:hypothetical protein
MCTSAGLLVQQTTRLCFLACFFLFFFLFFLPPLALAVECTSPFCGCSSSNADIISLLRL